MQCVACRALSETRLFPCVGRFECLQAGGGVFIHGREWLDGLPKWVYWGWRRRGADRNLVAGVSSRWSLYVRRLILRRVLLVVPPWGGQGDTDPLAGASPGLSYAVAQVQLYPPHVWARSPAGQCV